MVENVKQFLKAWEATLPYQLISRDFGLVGVTVLLFQSVVVLLFNVDIDPIMHSHYFFGEVFRGASSVV
jgi:hypothetical protein